MKKIFEYFGLFCLICFSFFITEKTTTVVQEVDDIMIQIKSEKNNYNIKGTNAEIINNTIIPGIVIKVVNVDKSYQNMKEKGLYDSSFYVYDIVEPSVSIDNNLDKYVVSGNVEKRMVSLLFLVENKAIEDIQSIVGTTPVSYVIEHYNIDKQIDDIISVNKLKNDILVAAENQKSYELLQNKLRSININTNYCYNELQNDEFLKYCSQDMKYSINVEEIIEDYPLKNVKKQLEPGSILVFKINDKVINELPNIISYIKSRGYTIETLTNHLSENW